MNSIQNKQSKYQTTTLGKSKLALGCLTAITLCLQSAPLTPVDAKTSKSKTKQSLKKRYHYKNARKNQIARLPFSKKDDEKEDADDDKKEKSKKKKKKSKELKSDKKKKSKRDDKKESKNKKEEKGKQLSDESDDIDKEVDVIEIDQDETKQAPTQEEAKSEAAEDTKIDTEASIEKPRLLPDDALISLLQDVSKLLEPAEKGVEGENPDEKKIIGLARKVLSKSLNIDGVKANRILEPEFNNSAKPKMLVEAWSSGDVKVSDDLNGSVAAVWGKRIGGLLNVTIAGDSNSLTTTNGSKIGKFLVVVSGKCSVKEGMDIQTQKNVPYWWMGEVATINVDAACLAKATDEENKDQDSEEKSQNPEDDDVKKKSLVILEEILTDRKREYLALFEVYQKQQEEKESIASEEDSSETTDNDSENSNKQKIATKSNLNYFPDGVEIIEVEEIIEPPKGNAEDRSIESEYYHIQEPEEESSVTKKKRTTRRIIRYPKNMKKQSVDNLIASKNTTEKNLENKDEEQQVEDSVDEIESPEDTRVERKSTEENDTEKEDSSVITETSKATNEDLSNKDESEKADEKNVKISEDEDKDSNKVETIKDEKNSDTENSAKAKEKVEAAKNENPEKVSDNPKDENKNKDEDKNSVKTKLASITTTAPIKPRINASPSPATVSSRKWESPASSFVTRQPSLGATVVYPARAIAGKFLTVAVIDKAGKPEASVELSFNGATLTTDSNGQAMFMVPEDATPGRTLHISLSARPELNPGVVEVLQPLFATTETVAPRIDRASPLVSNSKAMIIDGHDFLGMANKNRVLVDSEHNAKVIASSPVQLQLKLPDDLSPGKHKANIANTMLRSNPIYFEYIKAEVVAPKKKKKRDRGNIIVKIKGTKKRVPVRLVNKSPEIVKIDKGNDLLITTSGGADNSSKVEIKRLKKGEFKIDAKIEI